MAEVLARIAANLNTGAVRTPLLGFLPALALLSLACFEDPVQNNTNASGDGDGDGDGDMGTETSSGDGDGDPSTSGDGDGDPASGDGDGDPCDGELDECGVCNGPGSPCLGCTVPEASNYDELAEIDNGTCTCIAVGNPVADQSQLDFTNSGGTDAPWQSFTVGVGGGLARLDVELYSPLEFDDSEAELTIYEGEGIGGTELATFQILIEAGDQGQHLLQEFVLPDAVPLAAGRVYTFEITVASSTAGWVRFNTGNPYAGGISDLGEDTDMIFRTQMVSCAPE